MKHKPNCMKKFIYLVGILLLSVPSIGENNILKITQTVRGTVIDRDSKASLIGVYVIVNGTDPVVGTTTDKDGNFRLENIPIGRIDLKLTYLGYENKAIPNVTVESGKETILSLEMSESLLQLNEVVVNGGRKKGEALNEMSLLSSRTFTVEETKQYAGSFDDPSRMVSAFAGVTNDPSGLNEIIIRGNSPKGIQWRLEGVEIPNPNHFADESTTGGPINALSSNMLASSDFHMSAFAPEYGNVLSGIFDMKLRNGNNEKHEYTLGLGALGIDVSAEGPLKKGYKGSYLFNYRYSTLALLDNLKLVDFGGVPKYQDLTLKVNLPTKKAGTFSIFALGGISSIDQNQEDNDGNITIKGIYGAQFGIISLNHLYQLNSKSSLKTTISLSNNMSNFDFKEKNDEDQFEKLEQGKWNKNTITAATKYTNKINAKHQLVVGAEYRHFIYDMANDYFVKSDNRWERSIDLDKDAGMAQAYLSWKFRMTDELTMVSGLHYTNFLLNNSQNIEPRLGLKWQVSPKSSFSAGVGMHSMPESILIYYATVYDKNWNETTPNTDLKLTKARHYIVGYEHRLLKNLNAKLEIYYQDLYDVPVENDSTSYFSMINEQAGFVQKALVNGGKGRNYGAEFTLERYFEQRYYFLFTSSVYKSEYKTLSNVWRDSRYNGEFAFNLLVGKEFILGDSEKGTTLNLNSRFSFNGGQRNMPMDLEKSREKQSSVWIVEEGFKNRLDNIYQINFTASLKFNRPRATHEILIDVCNLLNSKGRVQEYFNEDKNDRDYVRQMSILPNIMYRIHF
jgi:hypothetical protein